MAILDADPIAEYKKYLDRCPWCQIFPVRSLMMKGEMAGFPECGRATTLLEALLSGISVARSEIRWVRSNWGGAYQAVRLHRKFWGKLSRSPK
ncbi:MAG: hypothetical protein WC450_09345 [Candidatus Omnitrophota bacterium]